MRFLVGNILNNDVRELLDIVIKDGVNTMVEKQQFLMKYICNTILKKRAITSLDHIDFIYEASRELAGGPISFELREKKLQDFDVFSISTIIRKIGKVKKLKLSECKITQSHIQLMDKVIHQSNQQVSDNLN